jgi:hypothetical protein
MSASAYFEAATLGQWFGGVAAAIPATVYVALFDVTGTELTSVGAPGYARIAIPNNAGSWSTPAGSQPASVANAGVVTFAVATGAWPAAIAFGMYDALTAGHQLVFGLLSTPTIVVLGTSASFPIGTLILQAN